VEQEGFGLTISIVPEERLTFFNVLIMAGVYTTADMARTLVSVAAALSAVTVNASITFSAFDDMCTAELQILPERLRLVGQYFMFQLRPDAIVMFTAAAEHFVRYMCGNVIGGRRVFVTVLPQKLEWFRLLPY